MGGQVGVWVGRCVGGWAGVCVGGQVGVWVGRWVCGCEHGHTSIRIPYVCASLHITLHYPYSTVLPYKFHVSAVQVTHIYMNVVWS